MIWPILLGSAASAATLLGGILTLRARGRLNLVMGTSAGIVLGVALLDLLPEALHMGEISTGEGAVFAIAASGCLLYLLLGRLLERAGQDAAWLRRQIGPASLTLHSLMDGAGIGLAFQVSPQLGWGVALAVLGHDIADGVNIVGLSLGRDDRRAARRWLALNALAPVVGAGVGQAARVPASIFALLLGLLAGIFLAMATGELLPRSLRLGRKPATLAAAAAGFGLVAVIVRLHG